MRKEFSKYWLRNFFLALTLGVSNWSLGSASDEKTGCSHQFGFDKGDGEMNENKGNKKSRLRPPCSVCSRLTRDTGKIRPSESMVGKNVHVYYCDYCKAESEGLTGDEYANNELVKPGEPDNGD
jgi:hypothetical protein